MFKTNEVKALVRERLTAAAEDIFNIFEKCLKEYEEAVLRSRQEQEQQRGLSLGKGVAAPAPLQQCVPVPQHNTSSMQIEEDLEQPRIKEEHEDDLWAADGGENEVVTDTKDSLFNIVYVSSGNEGMQTSHQNQDFQMTGSSFNSGNSFNSDVNSELLKSELGRPSCNVSQQTSNCQTSGVAVQEWRVCGDIRGNVVKPLQPGETSDRLFPCSVCNKAFRVKSALTRHMKTHTGEKPHSCNLCGRNFIELTNLQTHMNSHYGQKPYTCRFCGKGFTQLGNMNAHIRIHTGEKPHGCTICGKSFRQKVDLIKHQLTHTGEKPFTCSVCNMRFTAQSNLNRHMKTHSGERPFGCSLCGKRFIRKYHLTVHMKSHETGTY